MKWDEEVKQDFYPIPPAFQWRGPQQEINESRQQMRNFRRRAIRRYGYKKGSVNQEEIDKFITAQDGEIIEFNTVDPRGNSAIVPIQNAELGPSAVEGLIVGKDDFNLVAANSSELRGTQDRETATAAKISAVKEQAREAVESLDFKTFLLGAGREAMLQMQENFAIGVWIRLTTDPILPEFDPSNYDPNAIQELEFQKPVYQFITSGELDDGNDFELRLDISDATPMQAQEELNKMVTFFTLVQQFPQIALSPELIREVAFRSGYRNEKIIAEMQKNAILHLINQIQRGPQKGGRSQRQGQNLGGGARQVQNSQTQNSQPNDAQLITEQLRAQLGL